MSDFFINPKLLAAARDREALIVHPHAQRTGGNTVRNHILSAALGKERVYCRTRNGAVKWRTLTDRDVEGFKAVTDHFDFAPNAITRPLLPVAVLRHPLYRAVSLYHFVRRKAKHREHALAEETGDLEAFYRAASDANPRYYRNLQCRRLCGVDDARVALERIDKAYLGVGFTEDLDAFAGALGETLGWAAPAVRAAERDAERYDALIAPSFRDIVLKENAQDLALYETMRGGPPYTLALRGAGVEARSLVGRAKIWAKGVLGR